MKSAAIGLLIVIIVAGGGWVLAFGGVAPCEAMKTEARRLAAEKQDATGKAISETLANSKAGALSSFECVSMAVRMKALGRKGVTVLVAGGAPPAAKPEQGK